MRHLARHLALAVCLLATGSIADAAPAHKAKVVKKAPKKTAKKSARHHVKVAETADEEAVTPEDEKRTTHHAKREADAADDAAEAAHDRDDKDVKDDKDDDAPARTKRARSSHPDLSKHHEGRVDAEDVLSSREARPARDAAAVAGDGDEDDARTPATHPHTKTAKTAKHHERAADPATDDDRANDVDSDAEAGDALAARSEPRLTGTAAPRHPHAHADDDAQPARVAFADPDQPAHAVDADTIQIDAPVKLHKSLEPETKDWHVAIGPYLWASSVDANVSLGPTSVSSGVDFVQLEQHARYGMELVSEARYKQFGIYGDLMYGVVAVDGSRSVGPLMVSLDGEASSVLIDGAAGYTFYGDDHSPISLEGRAGVRYQRTGVSASLGLSGATIAPPEQVSAGADALAGGHVVVRPIGWMFFTGTADIGVVGASSRTWSASADANVQLGARMLLSLGYRTLTMDRSQVDLVLHGPRAAVQLTF